MRIFNLLDSTVLPAELAQYSAIIDGILAEGDLQTISAKAIRRQLQEKLGFDITDKKVSPPICVHGWPAFQRPRFMNEQFESCN
jgi:hypothetical protein